MNVTILAKMSVQFAFASAFRSDIKHNFATLLGWHLCILFHVDLQTPKSPATK